MEVSRRKGSDVAANATVTDKDPVRCTHHSERGGEVNRKYPQRTVYMFVCLFMIIFYSLAAYPPGKLCRVSVYRCHGQTCAYKKKKKSEKKCVLTEEGRQINRRAKKTHINYACMSAVRTAITLYPEKKTMARIPFLPSPLILFHSTCRFHSSAKSPHHSLAPSLPHSFPLSVKKMVFAVI